MLNFLETLYFQRQLSFSSLFIYCVVIATRSKVLSRIATSLDKSSAGFSLNFMWHYFLVQIKTHFNLLLILSLLLLVRLLHQLHFFFYLPFPPSLHFLCPAGLCLSVSVFLFSFCFRSLHFSILEFCFKALVFDNPIQGESLHR